MLRALGEDGMPCERGGKAAPRPTCGPGRLDSSLLGHGCSALARPVPLHSLRSSAMVSRARSALGGLHRFHASRARCPSEIAESAIRTYTAPGDSVLDPFRGSGTSLIAGLVRRGRVVGSAIDVLAGMLTAVTCAPVQGEACAVCDARGRRGVAVVLPVPGEVLPLGEARLRGASHRPGGGRLHAFRQRGEPRQRRRRAPGAGEHAPPPAPDPRADRESQGRQRPEPPLSGRASPSPGRPSSRTGCAPRGTRAHRWMLGSGGSGRAGAAVGGGVTYQPGAVGAGGAGRKAGSVA